MFSAFLNQCDLKLRKTLLKIRWMSNGRYQSLSSKSPNYHSLETIMNDSRMLANDYMDDRLIRSGLDFKQRKISKLKRSASKDELRFPNETTKNLSKTDKRHNFKELSKMLLYIGEALELRHPQVYTDILQQLNIRSLNELNIRRVYTSVAKELFSDGINWSKIVSLFAFAGGLAVDCVLNGSSIYIQRIKCWTVEFIESDLSEWIIDQGGWIGLYDHFAERNQELSIKSLWTFSSLMLFSVVMLVAAYVYFLRVS